MARGWSGPWGRVAGGAFGALFAAAACGDGGAAERAGDAATSGGSDAGGASDAGSDDAGADDAGGADQGGEDASADADASNATVSVVAPPTGNADCSVVFSNDTSNMLDGTRPILTDCSAMRFGTGPSQINFGAQDVSGGTTRLFNVDWFDAARNAGSELDVAAPFDFDTSKGAYASYVELGTGSPLWVASSGKVRIESVTGNTYVVKLIGLHFEANNDGPTPSGATGAFDVNGTITGTAP